jgi:hypothetical protein
VLHSGESKTDESSIPDFEPLFKDKLKAEEEKKKEAVKIFIAEKLRKFEGKEAGTKDFRIL